MQLDNYIVAAIISGSAGLLGALIGASISLIAARLLEKKRWERDDRLRFMQQRYAAYLGLLQAVERLLRHKDLDSRLADKPGIVQFLEAWNEIQLIGTKTVCGKANGFVSAVNDQLLSYHPHLPVSLWATSRMAFIAAIRDELGVEILDEPSPDKAGKPP